MKKVKLRIYLACLLLATVLAVSLTPVINQSALAENEQQYAILQPPKEGNGITYLLTIVVQILTGLVAVLAVASLIYAGVQYASAGDSQEKIRAAKDRITQTVIGILLYMFMYVILEFLIPGGVF